MLGLPSADQLTTPSSRPASLEDDSDSLTDTPRIVAALHAWAGWVETAEITQVLELDTDRTKAAADRLPTLLSGTGMTVLTSPQLGLRLAPDPYYLGETILDEIARIHIRSREPSYTTARIIIEAMLDGDIRHNPDDTTFDTLERLGYIHRGHTRYSPHPDIEYSINDAESRGGEQPHPPTIHSHRTGTRISCIPGHAHLYITHDDSGVANNAQGIGTH